MTSFFALLVLCAFALAVAANTDTTPNAFQILANHPGWVSMKKWMKEHFPGDEEAASLRGPEELTAAVDTLDVGSGTPRFIYTGVFQSSGSPNVCTGQIGVLFGYRFDLCQSRGSSSSKVVYGGLVNGEYVVTMQFYANSDCSGAPAGSSNMPGFTASCGGFTQNFIVDELPRLADFQTIGFRSTVSNDKKACKSEAKRGKDIPAENIREMFYTTQNSCMNMGDTDSGLVSCSKDGAGVTTFQLLEYSSTDGSCSGTSQMVTKTTADFCTRKRDTFIGMGYGFMDWTCNS